MATQLNIPANFIAKFDASFLAALATNFQSYKIDDQGHSTYALLVELETKFETIFTTALLATINCRALKIVSSPSSNFSYYSVDVDAIGLLLIATMDFVCRIQLCALLKPLRNDSKIRAKSCFGDSGILDIPKSDETHIVALIDHGCPFAHTAFRSIDKKSLRFLSIWDQDNAPEFPKNEGFTPRDIGYGRALTRDNLQDFVDQATAHGITNEELCYEYAAYKALTPRWTHGAAALGLLAANDVSPSLRNTGSDSEPGSNESDQIQNADIVFVQLPRGIPLAPVAGATDRSLLDGLAYVLASAGSKTKLITTVIDYGSYMGPHDGSSIFEKAVDALVDSAAERKIKFNVVFASGNGYNKGIHARINDQATAGNVHRVDWWLPPENDCSNFVDIWLNKQTDAFTFAVTSPTGIATKVQCSANATGAATYQNLTKTLTIVVKPQGEQVQIFMQAAATRFCMGLDAAPSGRWGLSFEFDKALVGNVELYTTWGGRNAGFPRRLMPSKFLKALGSASASVEVTGDGSLIGSACGDKAFCVGGYQKWGYKSQAKYSGAGAARGGHRSTRGNDVLATCEESPSLLGVQCIGTRSALTVRVNGTSVSAPQVGRILAGGRALPNPPVIGRPIRKPSLVAEVHIEYSEARL